MVQYGTPLSHQSYWPNPLLPPPPTHPRIHPHITPPTHPARTPDDLWIWITAAPPLLRRGCHDYFPHNTWRDKNVVIMSKRRYFDVITSKWRRFDVIMTSLLRNVFAGLEEGSWKYWQCSMVKAKPNIKVQCIYICIGYVSFETSPNILDCTS